VHLLEAARARQDGGGARLQRERQVGGLGVATGRQDHDHAAHRGRRRGRRADSEDESDHEGAHHGPSITPGSSSAGASPIAAGNVHVVAVNADGTLAAWGHDTFGGLGTPTGGNGHSGAPGRYRAVAAGAFHVVAITAGDEDGSDDDGD